ncbi:MAG: dTDP-4-dehydrorhamnose reductase [Rickettsiales bacterium]|jgi:dTDP-4-dehydrorhamnose reductase|nr:dTDP-4-dehydrorhamnose reductase [Rickettsiales bacterium]
MLLITGADGQLGMCLKDALGAQGALFAGRADLDIADEAMVAEYFAAHEIDAVVNCAAYTAVDRAEDEEDAANRVNNAGAGLMARYARRIIHISTDYVFDGTGGRPYVETDEPNPKSAYGRTKLAGERAAIANAESAVVIRTSWLYSPYGSNFVKTIRRIAGERAEINVVDDQRGCPTYAADLAAAIAKIIPRMKIGAKEIYHYAGGGECTWHEFAGEIVRLSGLACKVNPVATKDYPAKAARPAYSVLDKSKIARDFGVEIPDWRESLAECIKKMEIA